MLSLVCWASSTLNTLAVDPTWPQFRGPGGTATALGSGPLVFGNGTNQLWRVEVGAGNSSPCISGGLLFLTTHQSNRLWTVCLNREDGKEVWRNAAPVEKLEPTHTLGSPATASPATDGERVYVYFGSFGLLAYDFKGHEIWRKPLPPPVVEFGASASPIVRGKMLVQVCDQDTGSFLIALNTRNGDTIWRRERPEFRRSFATPYVWVHGGIDELIVPGSIWLKSYNLSDGSERWSFSGTSRVACSSPTASELMLFSASWNVGGDEGARITMPDWDEYAKAHDRDVDGRLTLSEMDPGPVRERFTQVDLNKDGFVTAVEWKNMAEMFLKAGNALIALKPDGEGDITTSHLAWRSTRSLPYVASPIYYSNQVYTVKNGGLASAYDSTTGNVLFQDERLNAAGDYLASPIAADGKIYLISDRGRITIMAAGAQFKILTQIDLQEIIHATPALVDNTLYVRSATHLTAFREFSPPNF